jgi:cytochrome c
MAGPKPGMTALAIAAAIPHPARAAGDPARGERVFQYCYSCHTVDPDEKATLQGPSLVGIVGRRIAAQAGFDYSPAMHAFAREHGAWSEDLLDRYVAAPEKAVPKTTMAFRGVEEADERADLIAYLKAQPKP